MGLVFDRGRNTLFDPTAHRIVRRHQQDALVKVAELARALGGEVWTAGLSDGLSGKLFRDRAYGGDSGYAIFVNAAHHENRRRFTVAHELGHLLLHRSAADEAMIEDDTFYRSRLSDSREAEANRAAAEILMPWHLIDRLVDAGHKTPQDLARQLKVSETAMRIRLKLPT